MDRRPRHDEPVMWLHDLDVADVEVGELDHAAELDTLGHPEQPDTADGVLTSGATAVGGCYWPPPGFGLFESAGTGLGVVRIDVDAHRAIVEPQHQVGLCGPILDPPGDLFLGGPRAVAAS